MKATSLDAVITRTTLEHAEDPSAFDAIVVGAGAAGGLAALQLCEAGLKVLVLDAGYSKGFGEAPVSTLVDRALRLVARPSLRTKLPYRVVATGEKVLRSLGRKRQPIQSSCYAWITAPSLFVDDIDNPYEAVGEAGFNWIRARGIGGRMVVPVHGRQYFRHCERDFQPIDDLSPAWPFEVGALDSWYALVEKRLGLSGGQEANTFVPDSLLSEHRSPDLAEAQTLAKLKTAFPAIKPILGRYAAPLPSLSMAARTGLLSCRTGAIAGSVDATSDRERKAVSFFDRETRSMRKAHAPVVVLGASTLESTRILLASTSPSSPEGIGARSGQLGANLMDHVTVKAEGVGKRLPESDNDAVGKCLYLPRFEARGSSQVGEGRGFGVRLYHSAGAGDLSYFTAIADAEMLPRPSNRVRLSTKKDAYGLPTLAIEAQHAPHELELAQDQCAALEELAELLDVRLNARPNRPGTPGSAIHECGTARIGDDPSSSVLNPYNECWDAKGVYVVDGAAFPSEGLANPTLTIMALTARACDNIVRSV